MAFHPASTPWCGRIEPVQADVRQRLPTAFVSHSLIELLEAKEMLARTYSGFASCVPRKPGHLSFGDRIAPLPLRAKPIALSYNAFTAKLE